MEAESPITRNLCTDVKQLEQSQGLASAVPARKGFYSLSKLGTICLSLFLAECKSEPCISVVYQLIAHIGFPEHVKSVVLVPDPWWMTIVLHRQL